MKSSLKSVPDAQLSTACLIAKQDFAATITDPREYQIELFERAKANNTIAVLDTGKKGILGGFIDINISFRCWKDIDCCALIETHHSARASGSWNGEASSHIFFPGRYTLFSMEIL